MPRVLVAEPSAPISAALRRFLDGAAEVVLTHYLDEAVQAVRARPPDVLIASVSGTFDGEVLCAQLRRQLPSVGVVLVYPPEEEQPLERAHAVGADAFLVGPLKKSAVLNTLRAVQQLRALRARVTELETDLARLRATPPPPPPPSPPPAPPPAPAPPVPKAPPRRARAVAGENTADEAFFKKYLLLEVKRSKRYQYPVALLLVALDGLSESMAGQPSPEFHRAVIRAEALKAIGVLVRDIDLAVPFGEDRYLVFLPHTPRTGCAIVAERIVKKLTKLDHYDGKVSVGVASYDPKLTPNASVSFGALVKDARAALTKAQDAGGGQVELAPLSGPVKRNRISMG